MNPHREEIILELEQPRDRGSLGGVLQLNLARCVQEPET